MKAFSTLALLVVFLSVNLIDAGLYKRAESGEKETLRFAYDGHTIHKKLIGSSKNTFDPFFFRYWHMMMVSRQATCYIFVLTDAEKALVHSDAGIRQVELTILARINDPNLSLTTVPHNSLHSNILKECGRGIAQYHIIQ